MNIKLFSFFILFGLQANVYGQSTDSTQTLDTLLIDDIFSLNLVEDIQSQLLPLDTLIDIAYSNSPTLRFHDAEVGAAKANLKLARRFWHPNLFGFASTSNGTQNVLLSTVGTNANSSSNASGYSYGVTVVLPLSSFTHTPVKIEMMRQELKKFHAKVDEAKLALKKEIIAEYFNLITSQRVLKIYSEDVQMSTLALNVAEIQFNNGNMTPQQFSQIKNFQTMARSKYEVQFQAFATSYFQFEAMVGVEMFKLKRSNQR